ncbi:DUF3565 domain-containing protein [Microbulbifer yueqingensis]|uniref:Pressure-regulated protein n=1 Tax=Microbulbifer yueqingensis TaxID=658219 RepID=A0A1G9EGP3_9GAMM|nr:DUF3565 domain-containing protein [Microbulbifer yueqingensis]SDK75347.1 Protein of unknown function [Microbulbifer yueqingensis]
MQQPITGYHRDEEDHWVAQLACGHNQHVRHHPPWQSRLWVTTPAGRESMLGYRLDCKKCDSGAPLDRKTGAPQDHKTGAPQDRCDKEPN